MNDSRRHFLKLGSAAFASTCVTHPSLLAASPSNDLSDVRPIGFSLYGMKSLPVTDAIEACARIGYNSVEVCVLEGFPTELERFDSKLQRKVRDKCDEFDIDISSLLFHGVILGNDQQQRDDIETIKRAGEISNVLNEKRPPLLESVMGGRKQDWDENKNLMADRLGKWAETAGAAGVKVAVKAHVGNAVFAPDQLLWLYHTVNHPSLTLTYDYSHYKAEGFEMESTMRDVIPHAGFIHVKDVALWKPVRFLFPGEGTIDWVRYFQIIRELKYTGPILVEVSAHIHKLSKYEPLSAAKLCYDALAVARDKAYA
tara:strand:+ start:59301 stop:60239 length:939 start_codon:yes stop_codon:yes gene_type:complete